MTNENIQILSFLLSIVALILFSTVFLLNVYIKIRKYFPIKVNCWFCNSWAKVPYENRNSFDCPSCQQYNGFTEDGSYNKIIEAQHEVKLNRTTTVRSSFQKNSNGLCESCNHNQQLKIAQLARFTPLKEENYDVEIEHFRNQLEKAYDLCKQCTAVLKSTLLTEKASIFGNHVFNIQKNGHNLYLKKSSTANTNLPILVRVFRNIQGFIAIFVILRNISDVVYSEDTIRLLPSFVLPYVELSQDLAVFISYTVYDSISSIDSFIMSILNHGFPKLLSLTGLILQMASFFMDSTATSVKMNQLLCWMFISLTFWATMKEAFIYVPLFQVLCASLIFYNSFYESSSITSGRNCFKKLSRSYNSSIDCSDDEFDILSQSAKSYRSFSNDCASSRNSSFNLAANTTQNASHNKTEHEKFTAFNSLNNSSTASNLNNTTMYSNIRSSLEDLHLGDTTSFKLNRTSPIYFSRPTSQLSDRPKLILSPSKLKSVTQNSWVAGGFWRNEDGTIIPLDEKVSLSRSSSQSSGFGSQIYERPNHFNTAFNSLPTSPKTSLCGDVDRFSLTSEPPYYFQPVSPPPAWNSHINVGNSNTSMKPQFSNNFGNPQTFSSPYSNAFVLPSHNRMNSMSLFNTTKPMGLFKLPQISPNLCSTGTCPSFVSRDFSRASQSPLVFN